MNKIMKKELGIERMHRSGMNKIMQKELELKECDRMNKRKEVIERMQKE